MNCLVSGSTSSTKSNKQSKVTKSLKLVAGTSRRLELTAALSGVAVVTFQFWTNPVESKQLPGDMYQNFLQAQIHSADCKVELAAKMRSVYSGFNRYRREKGRLPEQGEESDKLQSVLERTAGANVFRGFEQYLSVPATPEPDSAGSKSASTSAASKDDGLSLSIAPVEENKLLIAAAKANFDDTRTRVRIIVDQALSPSQLQIYKSDMARGWKATPGAITIIHNTEDFFVVWGAGIDGKPIADEKTGEFIMLSPQMEN